MEELRFKTRVSDTGTIQLPDGSSFKNKEVHVTIVSRDIKKESRNAQKFIQKWAGILTSTEEGDPKYDYLREKHP